MDIKNLSFIGGGRITMIFLRALTNRNAELNSVIVYEPDSNTASALKDQFPFVKIAEDIKTVAAGKMIFLAVHPPVIAEVLDQISDEITEESIIISLAPKITIEKIRSSLKIPGIARMIPNASSYINKGYNPVSFSDSFGKSEKKQLMKFFKILGKTIEVEENKLEAYAIFSAMLPTYFWFQWKKLEEIAVKTGLNEAESKEIIRSSLARSIKLFYNSGLSPEAVMDLIPVKPIGDNEKEIESILESKLTGLYEKIKA